MLKFARDNGTSRKASKKMALSAVAVCQEVQEHGLPKILSSRCLEMRASLSLFDLSIQTTIQMVRINL